MNNIQCINELALKTPTAAHVQCLPVTLLFGNDSATFMGGDMVPASYDYPTRAQWKRRQEITAMVEAQSAHTLGDLEEIEAAAAH